MSKSTIDAEPLRRLLRLLQLLLLLKDGSL
jgi:hypothetical protein